MIVKKSANKFEETALPHLNAVYRTAVALCGNCSDADDLVQITFLKAMEKFNSFEKGSNIKAWLLAILRNSWIDEMRKCQKHKTVCLSEDLIEQKILPDEVSWTNSTDLLANFTDEEVIKALQRIPEDQRLTLFLVDVEQYSHSEVAEITGTEIGTVKSRTSRARDNFRKQLERHASDMGYARGGL